MSLALAAPGRRWAMAAHKEPTVRELFQDLLFFYEDRHSLALSRIYDLEEQLAMAQDTIRRLIEGDAVEWCI